jgi:hypothetical protein
MSKARLNVQSQELAREVKAGNSKTTFWDSERFIWGCQDSWRAWEANLTRCNSLRGACFYWHGLHLWFVNQLLT